MGHGELTAINSLYKDKDFSSFLRCRDQTLQSRFTLITEKTDAKIRQDIADALKQLNVCEKTIGPALAVVQKYEISLKQDLVSAIEKTKLRILSEKARLQAALKVTRPLTLNDVALEPSILRINEARFWTTARQKASTVFEKSLPTRPKEHIPEAMRGIFYLIAGMALLFFAMKRFLKFIRRLK